jgi:hypothetical protein
MSASAPKELPYKVMIEQLTGLIEQLKRKDDTMLRDYLTSAINRTEILLARERING